MDNLKLFLMQRLLLVSAGVIALEALLMIPVRTVFLPLAAALAQMDRTGSLHLWDLFAIINTLLFGSGEAAMIGMLTRFRVLFLVLFSLFLFLVPLAAGIIVYAGIVTRRVDALQAEREAEHKAYDEERNLMLSDFAHDLRTPITTIAGYSGALTDGTVTDPEETREYLNAIHNKSIRMSELINLLFDYAKLGSRDFTLHKKECDLNALTAEITASLYTDIEDAGMSLTAEIPEKAFPAEADSAQAGRILNNLIVNAIRHNPEGTEIGVIITRLAGAETIAVADTGAEIPGDPEKLFDPFVKGDRSRSGESGSGLGLSISRKIAEMHGWTLSLSQPYGRYSKAFVIRIPER